MYYVQNVYTIIRINHSHYNNHLSQSPIKKGKKQKNQHNFLVLWYFVNKMININECIETLQGRQSWLNFFIRVSLFIEKWTPNEWLGKVSQCKSFNIIYRGYTFVSTILWETTLTYDSNQLIIQEEVAAYPKPLKTNIPELFPQRY